MNVQNIEDNNLTKNVDISDYYTLDKTNIHCFYQKLYKFYIKVPIKTICFIKKINKKIKNKNIINKNKINIKNKSSLNYCKDKEIRLENIKFNGKFIIAKIDNSDISVKKKKSNGSKKLFNLELFKEKEKKPPNINNNELNSLNKNIIFSEKKNINIQNKNLQIILDNNICKNINKNEFYQNNLTNSTSQIQPKFYYSQFTENNELPKHIKICLATKKLSNILLTKNEYDNIQNKRSITEEKFALGCSKLNNILNKKCKNKFSTYSYKDKKTCCNNITIKNTIFCTKNEEEGNNLECNNQMKINIKAYTYKGKNKNYLSENEELDNNEFKKNKINKGDKINEIKQKLMKLLNIMNINNINLISEKLSEIILYKDFDDIDEKEIIMINNIINKISNEKCDLYLYCEICKKINDILLNDNKNNICINQNEIIIKTIIQEVYKRINDWKYFNTIKIKSEKQYIEIINQIFGLINFIFELIESKLITNDESFKIIQELMNEYQKYERKIKYIFLKGSVYLSDYYFNILENLKIKEPNLLENLFFNKLKLALKDINFSNNLKLHSIIEKFIENPQKNNYGINDLYYLNSEKKNKKKNTKISENIIKKLRNNRLNKSNNNNNYKYQDENGGIQNEISDNNTFEEVSFKIDNNIKIDKNILNTEYNNNSSSKKNISGNKSNNNISLINNMKYDLNKNPEYNNKIALKKKAKAKAKKNSKSSEKNLAFDDNKNYNDLINEKEKIIYEAIQKDFDEYFKFLLKKGIKSKNDLFIDINYSYNWKLIDDLIIGKKIKLEEIIKIIIDICKNNNNINNNDIFKINEYIKTILEYYSNNLSENQFNIFHLNMIEIFMSIDDIVNNNDHSEIMFEIMGNILFILLKNKLYYIKDLNNFIDKKIETQINFCKVVKYAIIASGTLSKQYINDFKYTKLFNKSELFDKYVLNEL